MLFGCEEIQPEGFTEVVQLEDESSFVRKSRRVQEAQLEILAHLAGPPLAVP